MLRLLIVDDEPLARRGLQRLLAQCEDVVVVDAVGSLSAALEAIANLRPDALLLDVALGQGQQGFEVFSRLAEPPPAIFITAFSQYAINAFGVDAVDYLLKPVRFERLQEALHKLRRRLALATPGHDRVLVLNSPQRVLRARLADLVMIRADGDYCHVHVEGQEPLMLLRSLAAFASSLPQPPFLRVGRSLIVNCDRVVSVQRVGGQAQVLLRGRLEPLTLGQAAAQRLQAGLGLLKS